MQNIYFYPKLTDKLLENCGCSVTKYVFTYSYQGQDFGLLQKGNSTIRISDPREIWKIETEGLNFEKTVRIAYPNLLFGKDGVACSDAEIGICIIWTNKKLTQTGCILPETDVITPQGRVCKFSYSFEPGMITGDLELTVSAYIKKAANVIRSDEEILMNEEGVSIGEIDSVIRL